MTPRRATVSDEPCDCGCAKACHRPEMVFGRRMPGRCRHCLPCQAYRADTEPDSVPPNVETDVVATWDAHACLACGARYGHPFTDHLCGPLTPVTVTITRILAPAGATPGGTP